jgi:hypothetical protein
MGKENNKEGEAYGSEHSQEPARKDQDIHLFVQSRGVDHKWKLKYVRIDDKNN